MSKAFDEMEASYEAEALKQLQNGEDNQEECDRIEALRK